MANPNNWSTNLIQNPQFEGGDYQWTKGAGWTIVDDAANARSPTWVAKGTQATALTNARRLDVGEGDTFVIECMGKSTAGAGGTLKVFVEWFTALDVSISRSSSTGITATITYLRQVFTSVAAPATAVYARMGVELTGAVTGTWYAEEVICMPIGRQTFLHGIRYSITRDVLVPRMASMLGGGAVHVRRRYDRPAYAFHVQATHEDKDDDNAFFSFVNQHLDTAFWFSGDEWLTQSINVQIGFGNNVRTQWFLPNRNIRGGLHVYEGSEENLTMTLDKASGLITFSSAPALNMSITAGYICRYKCVFWPQGDAMLSEQQFYHQLYRMEGIMLREVVP